MYGVPRARYWKYRSGGKSSQRFHGNLEPCGIIIIILHNDDMTVAIVTVLSLEGGDFEVPVWGRPSILNDFLLKKTSFCWATLYKKQ